MRLVFDIEADDLYQHATEIHCICVEDIDTGEHWAYGPDELEEALKNVSQATLLVAHNGCGYDIPVLKKVLGWTPPKGVEIRDTMVWGSLCFSNLKELDFASNDPEIRALSGSQSLEAWGKRLGEYKQDYQGGFEQFTPEMLEYCSQDVKTTKTLFKYLEKQYYSLEALKLEQRIHYEYSMMEYRGIAFDKEAAEDLAERLQNELQRLQAEINGYVPPLKIEKATPQFWTLEWPDKTCDTFPTKGEAEAERKRRKIRPRDVVLTRGPNKFEIKEFNPGSSKQVRDYFVEKYGWISPKLTGTGQEKFKKKEGTYEDLAKEYGSTEEDILRTLEWPEAEIIADYGMVSKVYSMAVSGSSAWLEQLAEDGRMHPRFRHIGAVTHRSSSCIEEGQRVKTPEGDIPIKDVVPGQYVYSWTPEHGWRMNKVLEVIDRGEAEVFDYFFNSRSGDCVLRCTPSHRIMTQNKGYVRAGELVNGEKIAYLHTSLQKTQWGERKWLHGTGYFCKQQSTYIKEQLYPEIASETHMHHKDENKLNDAIKNLDPVYPPEHAFIHMDGKLLIPELNSKWAILKEIARVKGEIRAVQYDFDTFKKYCTHFGVDPALCRSRYQKGSKKNGYVRRYVCKGELRRAAVGVTSQHQLGQNLGVCQRTAARWLKAHGLGHLLPNAQTKKKVSKEEFLRALEQSEGDDRRAAQLLGVSLESIRNKRRYWGIPVNHWYMYCKFVGVMRVLDLRVERDENFVCEEIVVHNSTPNIQQVPSVSLNKETGEPLWGAKGRFGAECRALFIADPGHWIVGMDLSGIEARMLAHFLEPFDQGAYIDQVLNGDIHQLNVTAIEEFAGYSIKRSDTKPMYYGKLYSIGNVKQGQVVVDASEQAKAEFKDLTSYYEKSPSKIRRYAYIGRSKTPLRPSECAFADIGEKVNTALTKGIAGLEELDTQVKQAAKRGYLAPLDMRHIPMRTLFDENSGKGKIKTNAALNTLLQGSAGIVFKRAVVSVSNEMRKKRIPGQFLLVCHDELQTQVREGYEEEFTEVALAGPRRAGEHYGLKIPIEGETKRGRSWLETH